MKHMKPMDIREIKKKLCTFFLIATHSEKKHCKPRKIKTQQKPTKIDHDNNPKRKIEKLGKRKHTVHCRSSVIIFVGFFVILDQHEQRLKLSSCDETKNHRKVVNDAHTTSKPNKKRLNLLY